MRFTLAIRGVLPSLSWAAPASTPELIAKGKMAYTANCVTCHGDKGNGLGPAGKYMSPKPRNFIVDKFKNGETASEIFTSISKGIDGTSMVGFVTIPEDDRWGLVYYVQSFKPKK